MMTKESYSRICMQIIIAQLCPTEAFVYGRHFTTLLKTEVTLIQTDKIETILMWLQRKEQKELKKIQQLKQIWQLKFNSN